MKELLKRSVLKRGSSKGWGGRTYFILRGASFEIKHFNQNLATKGGGGTALGSSIYYLYYLAPTLNS